MKRLRQFAIALLVLSWAPAAFAAGDLANDTGLISTARSTGLDGIRPLPELIGNYIQQLFGVIGIAFVCGMVYAGFLWTTDGGEGKKAARAKAMLRNMTIGLLLMLASYSITSYVVSFLVNVDASAPQSLRP